VKRPSDDATDGPGSQEEQIDGGYRPRGEGKHNPEVARVGGSTGITPRRHDPQADEEGEGSAIHEDG
jgi:hypothetical protein